MPDYDPKSIPVLDDIIEDESTAADTHEKIIVSDEMHEDDNTLDLFNAATAEIEVDIDNDEPEIGTIEKHLDGETEIDIKATEDIINETPDDEQAVDGAEVFESALIDYAQEDRSEETSEQENALTSAETETSNSDIFDEQDDQSTDIAEPVTDTEPETTLNIDTIIDDIVSQMMPELEQTLRSRLKLALQEQLPQDGLEPTASE